MTTDEIVTVGKAVSHPLRIQILRLLATRDGSPRELADELHEVIGVVAYHVRQLRDNGQLALVREAPVRGSVQHVYALSERGRATLAWIEAQEG